MKTTAMDVLAAHCDVLPFPLLIDRLCHRAALRLCTLPKSHPLARHVSKAARCYVRHHKSPLPEIMATYNLNPSEIETILPVRSHPSWTPPFVISIAPTKEKAEEEDDHWDERTKIRVYSDGSNHDGAIRAAAILVKAGCPGYCVLRHYLGTSEEHTVYEAEIVGELLGVEFDMTGTPGEPYIGRSRQ